METIMSLPEVREIEESTSKFLVMAQTLKVNNPQALEIGNGYFLEIKARIKIIDEKLIPKKELAYRAYQEWLNLIKELKAPLEKALKNLDSQITYWKVEQDRIRAKETERLRQKALKEEMERRKQEEEDRLTQAAALDEVGAHEEAEAIIEETIQENSKPVEIYIPPPETQKVKLEGATMKTYRHAEIREPYEKNFRLLCKGIGEGKYPIAYAEPNMKILNNQARDLGDEMRIDGVRAVETIGMAATGKR